MGLPILRSAALFGNTQLYASLGGRLSDIGACSAFHLDHHNPGETYIAYRDAMELLECAADRLGRPDYGLQLSTLQDLEVLGALGVAGQATQTLRDSYRLAERFMGYHSPLIRVRLEPLPDDRYELISFDVDLDSKAGATQAFELSVGLTHRCYRLLTNNASEPLEVWMRHKPISPMATYRAVFGVTPKFDQPTCGIVVHKAQLLRRPPHQNQTISMMAEYFLASVCPRPNVRVTDDVRHLVQRFMRTCDCSQADVARHLGISSRALQRRLQDEGTSFAAIHDEVRRALAEEYMRDPGLSLAEISRRLHYSEASAFTRSCRRWFGKAPRSYRQRQYSAAAVATA